MCGHRCVEEMVLPLVCSLCLRKLPIHIQTLLALPLQVASTYWPLTEQLAELLGTLDVLGAFASVASTAPTPYVRPTISPEGNVIIHIPFPCCLLAHWNCSCVSAGSVRRRPSMRECRGLRCVQAECCGWKEPDTRCWRCRGLNER